MEEILSELISIPKRILATCDYHCLGMTVVNTLHLSVHCGNILFMIYR